MYFAANLQYLRGLAQGMTQEYLAGKLGVSRQSISKWESGQAMPELDKVVALCQLFSCTLDELLRQDMAQGSNAYSGLRVESWPQLRYAAYTVISTQPENDALQRMEKWACAQGITTPQLVGWDFPFLSQEQINVYHMHGYTAACILPDGFIPTADKDELPFFEQSARRYAVITIKEPSEAPFVLIPNGYKTLMRYMDCSGLHHRMEKDAMDCFERAYWKQGKEYMDIYIAVE